ncbi:MAG: YcgN family cysteine cluster protein [Candidatus Theseobacter exili]|nr:YcgN family cysteine cluster protein [Candidatus Theseobacter exili]
MQDVFWKVKKISEFSNEEWESVCDGCAKCCVHKLQDDETNEVHYTNVACRYLDLETLRCTCYMERKRLVPDCVFLSPDSLENIKWLPDTCAYRLLFQGSKLPEWHPLITEDSESVHCAGISVKGRVVKEDPSIDVFDHIM